MKIDTLEKHSEKEIYESFKLAFSDYQQPMNLPFDRFHQINVMRGVEYQLSIGAIDKEKLVGFILNAVRNWEGINTAYDCGTGIIPKYRGKGIGTQLLQECQMILKKNHVNQYLLEVIQSNNKAFNLYQNQGFQITREFECLIADNPYFESKKSRQIPEWSKNSDILIESAESCNKQQVRAIWDSIPSWQNSLESVMASLNFIHIDNIYYQENWVGYTIYSPSGEIYQLAIHPDFRKQGLGTILLDQIRFRTRKRPKNFILNVDTHNTGPTNSC